MVAMFEYARPTFAWGVPADPISRCSRARRRRARAPSSPRTGSENPPSQRASGRKPTPGSFFLVSPPLAPSLSLSLLSRWDLEPPGICPPARNIYLFVVRLEVNSRVYSNERYLPRHERRLSRTRISFGDVSQREKT